jgi:hypothetical protein
MKIPFFSNKEKLMSGKERVLLSEHIDPSGRRVAEKVMTEEGVMLERLFNYIGKLEGEIKGLSYRVYSNKED